MKKIIGLVMFMFVTVCLAQYNDARAKHVVTETTGTTQYVGIATTTINNTNAVSQSAAKWRIIKIVDDGTTSTVQNAYGSGTGDNALWTTAWTNRVNATYR